MISNIIVIFIYVFIGTMFLRLPDKDSYKRRKQFVIIVSVILVLQSCLRNLAVGEDTYAYFMTFTNASRFSYHDTLTFFLNNFKYGIGKDPGFFFMEKFFNDILYGNFRVFLILVAILFFYSLGRFILTNIRKLSDVILAYVIYSVLYFSFYSITGIRQTIAMAIVMLSIPYIKKKKIVPFILIILVASTIHKSAIIFIIFYVINRYKSIAKYIFTFALLLFPVAMIFKGQFLILIQSFMGYDDYQSMDGAGTMTFTILFLFVSLFTYLRRKYIEKNNVNFPFFFNALAVCLVFLPLSWINPSLLRIIMFFSIYLLVIIPEIINSFSTVSMKFTKELKVFCMIILVALYIKSNNGFEYGFFWDEMQLSSHYYQK